MTSLNLLPLKIFQRHMRFSRILTSSIYLKREKLHLKMQPANMNSQLTMLNRLLQQNFEIAWVLLRMPKICFEFSANLINYFHDLELREQFKNIKLSYLKQFRKIFRCFKKNLKTNIRIVKMQFCPGRGIFLLLLDMLFGLSSSNLS